MPSSRKRKNTFPSKLKTASTFYPKGTMSKSAKRIYNVSMNHKYAPGGPGSAIKWLTYYMNRGGKNLMKARRMLQKANKSGPFRKKQSRKPKKKSRKPKKSSRKRLKPKKS